MIKLGPRTLKGNFVGYVENSKAYRILDSSSNVIMESRDTEFIKNKFQTDSNSISELINNSEIEIESTNNASFDPNYRNKKKTQIDHFIELRRSQHVWGGKRIYIWIIYLHNILFF